ncbi:MAG: TonB-dependent receptor [Chitinophagaceae bacterium]|nr:MAG: TonB-dependent receptor [Chitinophagaceae bacterium]
MILNKSVAAIPNRLFLLIATTCFFCSTVIAQSTSEKLSPTTFESDNDTIKGSMLETVTITAEKRPTLAQKTPSSVSVLNSKKLEDYRVWTLQDLNGIVPNLFVTNTGSDMPYYSIRSVLAHSTNQSVAIYIDGVMQYDTESTLRNLSDIDRIEVLRGPQGTLYGRNAMAGVINIITKKPTNTTSGYANLSFGNYSTQRYTAGIKAALVADKLFAGLSGSYNKTGGFNKNIFTNKYFDQNNALEGSLSLAYLPSENWTLNLNLKAQETNNHGSFPYTGSDSLAMADGHVVNQNVSGKYTRHLYNASFSAHYKGKWFNMISTSGFQYSDWFVYDGVWDADYTPFNLFEIGYGGSPKENYSTFFTQEVRFNNTTQSSERLTWTAGAFLMDYSEKENSLFMTGKDIGDPNMMVTPTNINNKGFALYGQATYALTPRLFVTGGLRYDYEDKYMYTQTTMVRERMQDSLVNPRKKVDGKYKAFSPKFNMAYHINGDMMVYLNYARGYRSGGLNSSAADPDFYAYDPEFSNTYELGYKASWFNKKLVTNITAFYTDWVDMQVLAFGKNNNGHVIRNTGNSRVKGIELELMGMPVKGLNIDYNFSYNHGRYTKLTKPNVRTGTEQDLKGNWLLMSPEYISMLAVQYTPRLSANVKGLLRAEWSAFGKHYFNIDNKPEQDPYSLFNAKAGIEYKNIALQLWAKNILNQRYRSYVYSTNYTMLGAPATYGLSISYRF